MRSSNDCLKGGRSSWPSCPLLALADITRVTANVRFRGQSRQPENVRLSSVVFAGSKRTLHMGALHLGQSGRPFVISNGKLPENSIFHLDVRRTRNPRSASDTSNGQSVTYLRSLRLFNPCVRAVAQKATNKRKIAIVECSSLNTCSW